MDDKQREKEDRLIKRAMKVLESRVTYGPVMQSPATVREYLVLRFAGLQREVFTCLFLDTRHRVIAPARTCSTAPWAALPSTPARSHVGRWNSTRRRSSSPTTTRAGCRSRAAATRR